MNNWNGKNITIVGDSISTLKGYIPEGYNIFYQDELSEANKVFTPADTWWGKVIDRTGGKLLQNNSWSGSLVSRAPERDVLWPSASCDERIEALAKDGVSPEVILCYIGINDWGNAIAIETDGPHPDCTSFLDSYHEMLRKMTASYPAAKIYCCTLCFGRAITDGTLDKYNAVIRSVAPQYGATVLDIAGADHIYESLDGPHPTANGMEQLAGWMLDALRNCEN